MPIISTLLHNASEAPTTTATSAFPTASLPDSIVIQTDGALSGRTVAAIIIGILLLFFAVAAFIILSKSRALPRIDTSESSSDVSSAPSTTGTLKNPKCINRRRISERTARANRSEHTRMSRCRAASPRDPGPGPACDNPNANPNTCTPHVRQQVGRTTFPNIRTSTPNATSPSLNALQSAAAADRHGAVPIPTRPPTSHVTQSIAGATRPLHIWPQAHTGRVGDSAHHTESATAASVQIVEHPSPSAGLSRSNSPGPSST